MMTWRYLTDDSVPADLGLAVDEAMMNRHGRTSSASTSTSLESTLRLYSYRAHCALVGRYQDVASEVDQAYCVANDVQISRRPTGGGAILMGPGQLGVALVTRVPPERSPRETLRDCARGVIEGLHELGIRAQFRSKNDLEVGGRKIAGLGLYLDPDGALLFHASVLIDLDLAEMLQVLQIPGAKISDKAISLIGERVTTVSRVLNHPLTAADVRPAFRRGFERAFGITTEPDTLSAREQSLADELTRDKYGHPSWIHQRSPRPDARGTAILKTPEGLLRVFVAVHGDVIKSALLCGDFNELPHGITELESALKWCRIDDRRVLETVSTLLAETDLGVSPQAIADVICEAANAAIALAATPQEAHPARDTGACYAPTSDATDRQAKGSS